MTDCDTNGVVELAAAQQCRSCGADVMRVVDRDSNPVHLDLGMLRGVDINRSDGHSTWGWALIRHAPGVVTWSVHHFEADPERWGFLDHCDSCPSAHLARPDVQKGQQVTEQGQDPFGTPDKRPAVSFKGAAIGTSLTLTIDADPRKVQSRDFESGEPKTFANGDPMWSVATDVILADTPMTLWADVNPKAEGSMYRAIADAQKAAGVQLAKGGTLVVQFYGEEPSSKGAHLANRKLYRAHYTPPAAFSTGDDPWAAQPQPTTQPATTPAATPVATPPATAAAAPPWAQ